MRLCKALLGRGAIPGHKKILETCLNRRDFADQAGNGGNASQISTQDNPNSDQLASDRDDVFKINPKEKTVETVLGDLPLSPVMDPTFWEATRRHQAPKAKPGKPQNSVERQLRANPFAKALATPLRMCALTRTRQPSFFLQDFNLVAHPETGAPWFVPHSLIPDERPEVEEVDIQGISEAIGEASSEETPESTENPESKASSSQKKTSAAATSTDDGQLHGRKFYALARRDLLSSFTVKGSGLEQGSKQLGGPNAIHRSLVSKAVWRQDMDTYILGQLQQDIVNDILYMSKLCTENGRYYIVKCYGWGDVQYKQKGAVLWFGEPAEDSGADSTRREPGPFATLDTQKTDMHVVVHNMPMLLGSGQAARVREEAAALKDGSIFMLAGRRTTNLQLKLWKLQGYLADYT
ncbi:hypothetical protein GGR54DRAFT_398246 [Hypoxylon sp. NC1633]|nr:hypothetical protein GGR54DRAFT_398246 [Hypoxylon sp. NC1633]